MHGYGPVGQVGGKSTHCAVSVQAASHDACVVNVLGTPASGQLQLLPLPVHAATSVHDPALHVNAPLIGQLWLVVQVAASTVHNSPAVNTAHDAVSPASVTSPLPLRSTPHIQLTALTGEATHNRNKSPVMA